MKPQKRQDAPSPLLDALATLDDPSREHGLEPTLLERALVGDARAFLARPGKAFRARLIETSYALAGGLGSVPLAAIEAVELLHGGSLIVDDIQDDAEVRRGAPALHRLIGTPRALNTGNWLYFVALARLDALPLEASRGNDLGRAAHRCLVQCHEGQALDLALRVGDVRRLELPAVVRAISALKTGALTGFAARLGAVTAGAPQRVETALAGFGRKVGIALQMLDDLGSFVSPERHHKALEDLRGERVGWTWAWASEVLDAVRYKQLVRLLEQRSELDALRARLAEASEPLGRARVREALEDAEGELTRVFAPSHALDAVHLELLRLEKSYG